jgi:hypothetical protein
MPLPPQTVSQILTIGQTSRAIRAISRVIGQIRTTNLRPHPHREAGGARGIGLMIVGITAMVTGITAMVTTAGTTSSGRV